MTSQAEFAPCQACAKGQHTDCVLGSTGGACDCGDEGHYGAKTKWERKHKGWECLCGKQVHPGQNRCPKCGNRRLS